MKAWDALDRLRAGNLRFASGTPGPEGLTHRTRRSELTDGQEPFAIVLGCSDSRVPAEIVFDQGLGDLFVIRVAGNIVAPSQIGSVEFAAEKFGTRLVVVLGHSRCGRDPATLEELPAANGQPVAEPAVHRGSRSPFGRGAPVHRSRGRFRGARESRRPGKCSRLGQSSAPRLGDSGAPRSARWPAGRRRRGPRSTPESWSFSRVSQPILPDARASGVQRREGVSSLTAPGTSCFNRQLWRSIEHIRSA